MIGDKLYFEDLGVDVSECNSIEEVLNKSKLNYSVEKQSIYLKDGREIKDNYATVKNNETVLGVVGKDYTVLSNSEGFDFVDELINTYNFKFVRAGEWSKGERSFIVLSMPEIELFGDKLIPYVLLTNCYDGSGSVKAIITPVINNNAIMFGDYKYLIRHSKNVKDRPVLCEQLYAFFNSIIRSVAEQAEIFNIKNFTKDEFIAILSHILGIDKSISNIKRERAEQTVQEIMSRYYSEEMNKFGETFWRAVLCIAGQECQRQTLRDTGNSEIFLYRILNGMKMLNQFIEEVK